MSRIPSQQIDTLQTPGLVIAPVATDSNVGKLLLALELVGRSAEDLATVDRQEKARRAREDADAAELDRGLARTNAAVDFEKDQPRIRSLSPTSHDQHPLGSLIEESFAPRLEGHSDAYRRQYLESARAAYAGEVANQVQKKRDQDLQFATDLIASNVTAAKSLAEVQKQEAEYLKLDPRHTPQGFSLDIVTQAMKVAAETGDGPAVEAYTEHLAHAGLGEAERKLAQAQLRQAQHEQQSRQVNAFQDDIARVALNGQPFDKQRETALSYRGRIPDEVIQRTIEHIDSQERTAVSTSNAAANRAEFEQARAAYDAVAMSAIDAGLGFMLEDQTASLSSGEEKPLRAADAIKGAMDRAFERINAHEKDPEVAFARMADLASRNGYQPPLWKRTLAAGAMAATETSLAPEGKEAPLPPAAVAGFGLAKRLKAQSPALYESMLTDDKEREFYELAMVLQEDSSIANDDQRALLAARKALSGPGAGPLGDIKENDLKAAAEAITDRWFGADARNGGEIASRINNLSRALVKAGGLSPGDAVERAARSIQHSYIIINGWAVPTGDRAIPDQVRAELPTLASGVLQAWADKHGAEEGLEATDLTLKPSPASGFWMIVDGRTGLPVRSFGDSSEFMFAPSDLIRMAQEKQKAADAEIIKQQNEQASKPGFVERSMGGIVDYTSDRKKRKPDPVGARLEKFLNDNNNP